MSAATVRNDHADAFLRRSRQWITVRRSRTREWSWRCEVCGWVGVGLGYQQSAMRGGGCDICERWRH